MNNDSINTQEKLAEIRPLMSIVQYEFVEDRTWGIQISYSKTKYSSTRQYNPKMPKKWGFKNFVRAIIFGFMYYIFVYDGKTLQS